MSGTSSRKKLEQGFSLLELLVAVAILAVGLISIQSLENQNIDASNYIDDLGIGMMLADYRLGEEQIKTNFGDFTPPLKSFGAQFPSFKVHTAIENGLSLPIELPIQLPGVLVVNVSWKFHSTIEKLMVVDYLPTSVGSSQGTLTTP